MIGTEPPRSVVLVTGASGYIGGQLAEALRSEAARLGRAAGEFIRVGGRRPDSLLRRWQDLDAVEMDVLRADTLPAAMSGVDVAYYLVHSMAEGETGFVERDRRAAQNFAEAAADAGVRSVVYLGGLGADDGDLSPHLASRHETGATLARFGPPTVELRAGMVVGAGSASFRMTIDLVDRLPVMVTPRWVKTRSQPIGIDDVVAYLARARSYSPPEQHVVVEIGGADVLTYEEMMRRIGVIRGRVPRMLPVPVLTPRLSSMWCGLVTTVPTSIARPLVDGLRNETVVTDDSAAKAFPDVTPVGFDEAVRRALER